MPVLKVLTVEAVNEVDARLVDGRALVEPAALEAALGWELKPEGLCRGDVCVPVRRPAELAVDDRIDLGAVATALGMATLLDDEAGILAVSAPAADRRAALRGRVAPDFTLPDLDGHLHTLEEFAGRKRLLIAFASW